MTNTEFEFKGLHHLALVSSDMERTVDFYSNVLGMPLVKTINLPGGAQHFFFDMGGDAALAFFWFPGAPKASPGVAAPEALPRLGDFKSGHGSMNHVAFTVDWDKFDEYVAKLAAKGVSCGQVLNHDDSERGTSEELHPGVYVRSQYFWGPDGEMLEIAAWSRALGPGDVNRAPYNAAGIATQPDPVPAAV
jgi:catechol 2,3-dioxygenase-like lactoylglutathione lyase family enzyme